MSLFFSLCATAKEAGSVSFQDNPEYRQLAKFTTLINQQFEHSRSIVQYILAELETRELPISLALIPMIESSFQPDAVSEDDAAGLWQLMPQTAKQYGLTVSKAIDERFNLYKSTTAALNYLAFLYQKFDKNLSLTLAAYNAGENRVQKNLEKNKYFAELPLPDETIQYVYRFHALQQIVDLSRYSASKTGLSPVIRLTSTADQPIIPLKGNDIMFLKNLFETRTFINMAKIQPVIIR
ncbi:lytic transglycosylase domain-containing protein [Vibrio sp. HA2012]|uniref:lytic transglycosylase domain-containing protein n=1 Tax=Vibrio sp. HA2012 TaxID=1971595 RepID=UPI0012FD78F0|nr:lytic transglycosylase domain-containing protein [Vibrio sp. HA2012]